MILTTTKIYLMRAQCGVSYKRKRQKGREMKSGDKYKRKHFGQIIVYQ
jgi:hypothetical protein